MAPDQRLESRGQARIRPASRRIRAADRVIRVQRSHLALAFRRKLGSYLNAQVQLQAQYTRLKKQLHKGNDELDNTLARAIEKRHTAS